MSVVGSDITVNQGEGVVPKITMGFCRLIGGTRLPSYKGDPTELQEWILSIQKKQVIYLKSTLVRQYASEHMAIEAVRKLFRLRQGDNEAMEDVGERIAGLTALMFLKLVPQNSGPIEAVLGDVYMDVLRDREL